MPLTNPNKVVTEERLSEFYGQILPYMGGMPEMLANKFSKGDLYSTDEKMIGCWTDGKPLYQKVFYNLTVQKGNSSIITDATMSAELFVRVDFCTLTYDGGMSLSVRPDREIGFFSTDGNTIRANNDSNGVLYGALIVQYTKTTDSPIAIGSDTDYSTDEKIVGTWIDGKPLYQKVVNFTTPNNSNWTSVATITGADFIMLVSARIQSNDGTNLWTTVPFTNPAGTHCCAVNVGTNKDLVCYALGNFLNRPAFAIVQYTKTS